MRSEQRNSMKFHILCQGIQTVCWYGTDKCQISSCAARLPTAWVRPRTRNKHNACMITASQARLSMYRHRYHWCFHYILDIYHWTIWNYQVVLHRLSYTVLYFHMAPKGLAEYFTTHPIINHNIQPIRSLFQLAPELAGCPEQNGLKRGIQS